MGSRTQSHQLSNGLIVSGRPEHHLKDRIPTMSSRAVPYTGGDVKYSGELGKMFDISSTTSAVPTTPKPPPTSGSARSGSNSGQLARLSKSSGPLPIPPTGLITSGPLSSSGGLMGRRSGQLEQLGQVAVVGPGDGGGGSTKLGYGSTGLITSGPLSSSGGLIGRRSGQSDQSGQVVVVGPGGGGSTKPGYGLAVTSLGSEGVRYGLRVSKGVMWVFGIVVLMGLLVGGFLMVAVKKAVMLVAVAVVVVVVVVGLVWNYAWGKRAILGFVKKFPDTELRGAVDGQFVKVTGVVTCGSIPLESSFQRVPRCVYVSTELYEYKGWGGKSANAKHLCFSWGCRHSEKYVADFYISDFHSGLRALVKTGYGAKVAPLVKPSTVGDITKQNKDLSPFFLKWLTDRSLSSDDDRVMRLKEGYVKEGSTMSVMGIVRRHENIVMIVPQPEPISMGCQWSRCLLPMYVEGLLLHCEDNQNSEAIPV